MENRNNPTLTDNTVIIGPWYEHFLMYLLAIRK